MFKSFPRIIGALGMILYFSVFVCGETIPQEDSAIQPHPGENQAVSPQQAVAEVLGRKIWASDLKPDLAFLQGYESGMNTQKAQEWLRAYRKERIKEIILEPLLEQYVQDHQIGVGDSEIQPLVSLLTNDEDLQEQRRAEENFLEEVKARKMALEQILQLSQVNEETRKETFEELARLEKVIPHLEKENLKDELVNIATQMVRIWKINQALYKEYGGRVILQQNGPEPLDAYRDFLKEKEKESSFHIYDEDLAKIFWEYFLSDSGHTFYTFDEGARLMEIPWWVKKEEGEKAEMGDLKN